MNDEQKAASSARLKSLPYWVLGIGFLIAVAWCIYDSHSSAKVVVARVNGEPIYVADLQLNGPVDTFDDVVDKTRQQKLKRLVEQSAIRQFLAKQNVRVTDAQIDEQVQAITRNLPTTGCPCCTFPDVDAYLDSIGYSMSDLRKELANEVGLRRYVVDSLLRLSPAEIAERRAKDTERIRRAHTHVWQIFFNVFQQPGDLEMAREKGRVGVQSAWEQLQKGVSFADVAGAMSQDMTSSNKGGDLGFIDRSSYGRGFEATLARLAPGEVSKPFETPWGFHIVKWMPMTREEIEQFCEASIFDREYNRIRKEIVKSAKVEYIKVKGPKKEGRR